MKHPVLLIHGLIGNLSVPRIVSAIGPSNVFAPDLLGYGEARSAPIETLSLAAQAEHVRAWIGARMAAPVHVVGHSVGGAVAVLFADKYPELTASLTSVEGNFTLKDAFWSAQIAMKNIADVEAILDGYKADVAAWIRGAGVEPDEWTLSVAAMWLANQPGSTLRAQARAVVEATGRPEYLETVRRLLASGIPCHLIAGERSRGGWDVPAWAASMATANTDIPGTGHLMMLESPEKFGAALRAILR